MLNNKVKASLRARSGIILPDHLRVRFHESSGTSVAYTGKLNGSAFSGSFAFGAAPTWGQGGAKAPGSNTTVKALATQAAHPDLFSVLTPPTVGGLILLWGYYQSAYTNNSSNNSMMMGWGNVYAGGDGYQIGTSQGANHNSILQFRGVGGSLYTASKVDNAVGVQKTVQQYLKTANGALAGYTAIDGNWAAAGSATSTDSFSHGAPANYQAAAFFTSVATGPATGTEYINRGATDDKIISDLLVIRDTDGSLYDQMSLIAEEHAKNRQELLWSLDTP